MNLRERPQRGVRKRRAWHEGFLSEREQSSEMRERTATRPTTHTKRLIHREDGEQKGRGADEKTIKSCLVGTSSPFTR